MQLTSYLENGRLTVVLTGEIDHHSAKKFMEAISAKIEAYTPRACHLDFTDITFMDSSGIAVVLNALRSVQKMGGTICLINLSNQPLKVFRAAGIDRIVQIKEGIY